MDKYLKMFEPPMKKWLAERFCGNAWGNTWKIRHKTLADGDGECNYWILGDKEPEALANVGSK